MISTEMVRKLIPAALLRALSGKQEILVSGENIKTVDGHALPGSGNVQIIPSQSGNAGKVLFTDGAAASWEFPLRLSATVAASGTAIDFTGIPSWAKRVTLSFANLSSNGASNYLVQLGGSGGIATTGYNSSVCSITSGTTVDNHTNGIPIARIGSAAASSHGHLVLTLIDPTRWVGSGVFGRDDAASCGLSGGSRNQAAALTTVRLTTSNGTDTFDAGSVSIIVEG